MVSLEAVNEALASIPDPEMPISIVDLGLVESVRIEPGPAGAHVCVDLLPTFVGCPALSMIEASVRSTVGSLGGVREVSVRILNDPPWTVDRISDEGREALRRHGVAVPGRGERGDGGADTLIQLRTSAVACPYCGSNSTQLDSPFGPTRCRMIYSCADCGNVFERMKRV